MTEGPAPAKIVPASVNDTRPATVDATTVTTDPSCKPPTVIAPVPRKPITGKRR